MASTRRLAAATLLLAVWLASSAALAQVSWQAFGTVTSGVTNDPNPGVDGDSSDGFTEATPGFRLSTRSGRVIHDLSYRFSGTYYYETEDARSFSNLLGWISLIQASENVRLSLLANFTQSQENSFLAPQAGVQTVGSTLFVAGSAGQRLDWQLAPRWTLNQSLSLTYHAPLDLEDPDAQGADPDPPQPRTLTTTVRVGLAHRWALVQLGGNLRATYNADLEYTPNAAPGGVAEPIPTEHVQLIALTGVLMVDLAERWSAEVEAGVLQASTTAERPPEFDTTSVLLEPVGLAALRYEHAGVTASLSGEHTIEPTLIGDTLRIERFRLGGRLPLGPRFRERWFVGLTGGYEYAQQIQFGAQGGDLDEAHVYRADLELAWRINPNFEASLRYSLSAQTELGLTPGFTRHAGMLGLTVRYPGERRRSQDIRRALQQRRVNSNQWQQFFAARTRPAVLLSSIGPGRLQTAGSPVGSSAEHGGRRCNTQRHGQTAALDEAQVW
jgi:hypothetical protein